ncbi:glycosyltransferase [Paraglaciecola sp. MB-3u-78]|uniref:glycosyltransferase n=1 Tax=Paraglaciecola sp. MB-3u-78 TaxID=2058332 RepID=UPI0012FEFA1C|nr:glycosyltransferase [Paraglaciecola sp. MB-3u-78]
MSKCLFVPHYKQNPYQKLLAEEMETQGYAVEFGSYPFGLFPLIKLLKKHKNIDVLHIHWIADLLKQAVWSDNMIIYRFKCLLLVIECWLIRLSGKRIIWTIHNKFAHEGYDKKKELLYRQALAKGVNKIIVHSKEALTFLEEMYGMTLSNKTEVVYHGSYVNFYPINNIERSELRSGLNIPDTAMVIGYFGQIRSYKGVESLIKSINELGERPDIYLFLAGLVRPEEYTATLSNLVKSEHIKLKLEYLSDQDLINYINMTDVICLPFADSLTSGSTILAMSCGKALLLPEKARIFGCVPEQGVKYFQSQEHLKQMIEKLDINELEQMGNTNFNKAIQMTWNVMAQKTIAVYSA